jgi:16S rRNA G527 N7-methylase RsmG
VDVITARALAPLDRILDYVEPFLKDEIICLFLKGRRAEGGIDQSEKKVEYVGSKHQQSQPCFRKRYET